MDGEFPEQFKCPICFKIPEKEIHQCQNGHTICNICIEKLSLCPLCRVSLGGLLIRSRSLEEILDMLKFNCSFKREGCTLKLSRRDISNHSETCSFGGVWIPLCKYLGYTCSHEVNTRCLQESLYHFAQHQFFTTNENFFTVKITNIKYIDKRMRCLWKPILVNAFNNHYLLVTGTFETNIFFMCISVGETPNDKVTVKFRMVPSEDNLPILEWTTKPILQEKSELVLKSPPYQCSLELITENYLVQNDLSIQVSLSKNSSKIAKQEKALLVLDSFAVLQVVHKPQLLRSSMQKPKFFFGEIVNAIRGRFVKTCRSIYNFLINKKDLAVGISKNAVVFGLLSLFMYLLSFVIMMLQKHS